MCRWVADVAKEAQAVASGFSFDPEVSGRNVKATRETPEGMKKQKCRWKEKRVSEREEARPKLKWRGKVEVYLRLDGGKKILPAEDGAKVVSKLVPLPLTR